MVKINGWVGTKEAKAEIVSGVKRYNSRKEKADVLKRESLRIHSVCRCNCPITAGVKYFPALELSRLEEQQDDMA